MKVEEKSPQQNSGDAKNRAALGSTGAEKLMRTSQMHGIAKRPPVICTSLLNRIPPLIFQKSLDNYLCSD